MMYEIAKAIVLSESLELTLHAHGVQMHWHCLEPFWSWIVIVVFVMEESSLSSSSVEEEFSLSSSSAAGLSSSLSRAEERVPSSLRQMALSLEAEGNRSQFKLSGHVNPNLQTDSQCCRSNTIVSVVFLHWVLWTGTHTLQTNIDVFPKWNRNSVNSEISGNLINH